MLEKLSALTPEQRARTILSTARAELNWRLWQAALGGAGDSDDKASPQASGSAYVSGSGLHAPLADMVKGLGDHSPVAMPQSPMITPRPEQSSSKPVPISSAAAPYAASFSAAATRTGIPFATLSAIIGAEARRSKNGAWSPLSRNPRSSAAGLGQFLSSTWLGLARQAGTWLNTHAREAGLIDAAGTIAPGAKSALLALRYDPQAAIETVADYARANVERLRHAGASIGESASEIARAVYIGHHLGPGDAVRFYNGRLDAARAAHLLSAQIGAEKASRHIASAGDAVSAHRGWLLGYVEKFIG
ncbi:MAG: peptidoglycan-binding protein [Sphingomonadaceae bacterium]|jgi:hypothetical protein